MQNRIRTRRCTQINGKFGENQTPSFIVRKIGFFFFFIFGFVACAYFKNSAEKYTAADQIALAGQAFSKICFSGEGKGRLAFLSEKQVFNFESRLIEDEKRWLLGIDIPMIGEEVVKLDYSGALNHNIYVRGEFYERLVGAAKKEKQSQYYLMALNSYLEAFGLFLHLREEIIKEKMEGCTVSENMSAQGKCKSRVFDGALYWKFQDDVLEISFPFDNNGIFTISAKNTVVDYYSSLKVALKSKNSSGILGPQISLDLSLETCGK